MNVKIYPGTINNSISVPPSKSDSHRAIICAALAGGRSTIQNIIYSDDINATINAMEILGAKIEKKNDSIVIDGVTNFQNWKHLPIDCQESGSTLRFILPLFSLTGDEVTITGRARLLERPLDIYQDIAAKQGITFRRESDKIILIGKFKADNYIISGDISSQFITGLLLTLPLLDADSSITILPPFESRSYVLMTIQTMSLFGVNVEYDMNDTFHIKGKQHYSPCNYAVEGDYSNASSFAVLGALNNELKVLGLNHESKQGDKVIFDIVERFGATVSTIKNGYKIKPNKVQPIEVDLQDCPDIGPSLMVLLSFCEGDSHIINTHRLAVKETNRIITMVSNLQAFGVGIRANDNEIFIRGKDNYIGGVSVPSFNDHRICMAMAVMATLVDNPVIVKEAECVKKSYPDFFEDLKKIGIKVEYL